MDIKSIEQIYGPNVEIRKLSNVKVMTPKGFKSVSMIKRSKVSGYYRVKLENATEIKASGSHKVLMQDGHFLYVNMLSKGMFIGGEIKVISNPEWIEEETFLYDLLDVEGNVYVTTNGVTNHNCAFIENIETTMTAALPTLSTGGQVMLLSTPNGIGNYFHSTWVKAELGENSFIPVKLPWQVHPERNQSWRDQQDADMGKRQASQECVSGNTLIKIKGKFSRFEPDEEREIQIGEMYNILQERPNRYEDFQIWTPACMFENFYGIRRTHKEFYYKLAFEDGRELQASDNHRVLDGYGEWIEVQNLKVGDLVTGFDSSRVSSIERIDESIDLYDTINVGYEHWYITNNFVSHNCDCDFLMSGDTFFEPEDMTFYEETYAQDPVEKRGIGSDLWIWEYPDYTKTYVISADVARGDGGDFSVAEVWDIESCTQVAEYRGQMGPKDFGAMLCGLATEYNDALLSIENANIGWATIEEVLHRDYRNLYYSSNTAQDTAESYSRKSETGKLTPGFTTSPKTRPLMLASLYDYVHQKSVILKSKRAMLELRTFVWNNSKPQAANGSHDDIVMSLAQGLYIRDTALKLRQQGLDLSRAQMSSFGNLNRRDNIGPIVTSYAPNPYQIQTPQGGMEDIRWVL